MHAIMITFELVDMTPERYADVSAELAPSFATIPGLLTKIWLTNTGDGGDAGDGGGAVPNRRAGLYLFTDASAADAFLASALARSVRANPHFADLTVRRFAIDETATALTQPRIIVVPVPTPA